MKLYLADDIYDFQSRATLPTFILSLAKFRRCCLGPSPIPLVHRFVFGLRSLFVRLRAAWRIESCVRLWRENSHTFWMEKNSNTMELCWNTCAKVFFAKCVAPKHSVFFTMDVRSFHVYCGGVARLPDIFNTWEISVIVLLSLKESLILILWYILKLNYLSIINKELINCSRFIQWEAQVGKVIIPN